MNTSPLIGLVMGSDSDWPVLQAAARILKEHGVPYEAQVVSAHRTPDLLFEYAATARERGLRAIIAGAGGAAHLPGMVAAKTTLPVLGGAHPLPPSQGNGLPALHRADAQRGAGSHLRHRRGGGRQRSSVCGLPALRCTRRRRPPIPAATRRLPHPRARSGAGTATGGADMILPPATLGMLGGRPAWPLLRDGSPPPRL